MADASNDLDRAGLVVGVRWDAATHARKVNRWLQLLPRASKHTRQPHTFRLDELWGDVALVDQLHQYWQTTEWSGDASTAEQEGVPVRVPHNQGIAAILWIRALAQLTGCIIRQHHGVRTVTLSNLQQDPDAKQGQITFVPFGSASSAAIRQLHANWKSPSNRATTFWHIVQSPYDETPNLAHRTAWPLHAQPPPAHAVDAIFKWMGAQLVELAPGWLKWCHEACFVDTRVGTGMFISRFPAGRRIGWDFDPDLAAHATGMIYPDSVWHMPLEDGLKLDDFEKYDAKGRWPRERRVAVCHPPGDDAETVHDALAETVGVADHVFLILPVRRSYLPAAFVRLKPPYGANAIAYQQTETLTLNLTLSTQPNGRVIPQRYEVLYYRTTPTPTPVSNHRYGPVRSRHSQRRQTRRATTCGLSTSPRNADDDDDDGDDDVVVVSPDTPDSSSSPSPLTTPTRMRGRDTYQSATQAKNQTFKDDCNSEFVTRIMTLDRARRSGLRVFYLDGASMGTTQALQNPPLRLTGQQLFTANRCRDTLAAIRAGGPTLNTFAGEALDGMNAFCADANAGFDAMYLDFCGTWATCSATIEQALQFGLRRNLEDATRVVFGFAVLAARQPRPEDVECLFTLVQTEWASLLIKHGWRVDLGSEWPCTLNHMTAYFAVLKPVPVSSARQHFRPIS